jgi:hypothetical protein
MEEYGGGWVFSVKTIMVVTSLLPFFAVLVNGELNVIESAPLCRYTVMETPIHIINYYV